MHIKAYLVEVRENLIRPVRIDAADRLNTLYRLIGCNCIDAVRFDASHVIYVDDNGLTDGLPCYSHLEGYPSPLAGNLLICGNDEHGDTVDPILPIEHFAKAITIFRLVFDPIFETINEPPIFGSRVGSFGVRIAGGHPTIAEAG